MVLPIHTRGAIAAALLSTSCVLAPVDLVAKPCPCAPGFVCDEAVDRCVRTLDRDPEAGAPPSDVDGGDAGDDAALDGGVDVDAHVDDPTTACDDLLAGAIFCESFEDVSLLHWALRESYDGTVGYSADDARRGVGSLVARSTAGGGFAERIATVVGGVHDGALHLRAYLRIAGDVPLVHTNLLHIGGHRSRLATEPVAGFNVVDGYAAMFIGAGNVSVRDRLVTVPLDQWFCVQLAFVIDDDEGEARVWIDGELAGEAVGIDTRGADPYVSLGAGIAWSALEQPSFTVRIDELAVGRAPLPCELPSSE